MILSGDTHPGNKLLIPLNVKYPSKQNKTIKKYIYQSILFSIINIMFENITISTPFVIKGFISLGIIFLDLLLQKIAQKGIDRYVQKNRMSQPRNLAMHKTKTITFHMAAIMSLIILWGVSFESAWVSLAGFIGLIAIGFFAVWSILSNIFAGVILFFFRPFKVDDYIEIIPDGISGKVKDINGFFVILSDNEGNLTHVPNNMFYQKIVKTLNHSPVKS